MSRSTGTPNMYSNNRTYAVKKKENNRTCRAVDAIISSACPGERRHSSNTAPIGTPPGLPFRNGASGCYPCRSGRDNIYFTPARSH